MRIPQDIPESISIGGHLYLLQLCKNQLDDGSDCNSSEYRIFERSSELLIYCKRCGHTMKCTAGEEIV